MEIQLIFPYLIFLWLVIFATIASMCLKGDGVEVAASSNIYSIFHQSKIYWPVVFLWNGEKPCIVECKLSTKPNHTITIILIWCAWFPTWHAIFCWFSLLCEDVINPRLFMQGAIDLTWYMLDLWLQISFVSRLSSLFWGMVWSISTTWVWTSGFPSFWDATQSCSSVDLIYILTLGSASCFWNHSGKTTGNPVRTTRCFLSIQDWGWEKS